MNQSFRSHKIQPVKKITDQINKFNPQIKLFLLITAGHELNASLNQWV